MTTVLGPHLTTVQSFIDIYKAEMHNLLTLKHVTSLTTGKSRALSDQLTTHLLKPEDAQSQITSIVKDMLAYRKRERSAKETVQNLQNIARSFSVLSLEQTEFTAVRDQISPKLFALAKRVEDLLNIEVIPTWNHAKNTFEETLRQKGDGAGVVGYVTRLIAPESLGKSWPRLEAALAAYEAEQAKQPIVEQPKPPEAALPPGAPLSHESAPASTFEGELTILKKLGEDLDGFIKTYPSVGPLKPPTPNSPPAKGYAGAATQLPTEAKKRQ